MAYGFSAIIPAGARRQVNTLLEAQGFGPDTFIQYTDQGTHSILHCWPTAQGLQLKDALQSFALARGITILEEPANRPFDQVKSMADSLAIDWPPSQSWLDGLPKKGDVREFRGVKWVSKFDELVDGPDIFPEGWERQRAGQGSQGRLR